MLVIVFTVSMFVSATLLFLVEPMLAKMLLPLLGGSAEVWNACLVFYQAMLLGGYLYAHAAIRWLGRRTQIMIHGVLVLLPLLPLGILPLHLPAGWQPPTESDPAPWILALLFVTVGLPFFALSSNTPIIQRWFADSGHKYSSDPYFLYAASNAGSLAGLLAYPFLIEPLLTLKDQSRLWSYGYVAFVALTAACALLIWSSRPSRAAIDQQPEIGEGAAAKGRLSERLRWIVLAFVPSSLMLGVTTQITTDVPAIPLFWVLPLALYLGSFVVVFAKRQFISHEWVEERLPLLILFGIFPMISHANFPFFELMLIYLLLLFGVALHCHGELARSRPQIGRLTEFYLLVSTGGVLGGIFNSLVAPVVFHSVVEFPLVLILAALLRKTTQTKPLSGAAALQVRVKDWLLPVALGLCVMAGVFGTAHMGGNRWIVLLLVSGGGMVWCLSFSARPIRFAMGLAALLLASSFYAGPFGKVLDTERSFFGVVRVANGPAGKLRYLIDNATLHGVQNLNPALSHDPLAYYTRSGPAGEILKAVQARMPEGDVAIVGLGAGDMACLLQPGEYLTFYEIDPLVVRIAENPRYFTFLSGCAPHAKIVLGDARLELRYAPDHRYNLIVLDAFSGDAIPMHLLTEEALALYLRKLAPGGVIAFHISNQHLQLAPTLSNLAHNAHLACRAGLDSDVTASQRRAGKLASLWVVMARNQTDLAGIAAGKDSTVRWSPIPVPFGKRVWTDDYSNLLSVIRW